VAAGVVLGVAVAVARPWLPDVFTDDPEVAALAAFLLGWVAALQPVNGAVFVLDGLLIGAGDMAFLAGAMWVAFAVFAVGAVSVLVLGLGIGWLWASLAGLMAARLVVLGLRWRTDRWAVTGASR
jgi:Na+-driven multidrug efflux pump